MNFKLSLLVSILAGISSSYAATPVDLRHQSTQMLQQYLPSKTLATKTARLKTIKADVDSKQMMHTRIQQTFAGIPVWGGDAIIHTPNASKKDITFLVTNKQSTMNGIFYKDLEKDLIDPSVLNEVQKKKAIEAAKKNYSSENNISEESAQPIIFVSKDNKAHYAYKISFYVVDKSGPHRPITIIDAATLNVFQTWDSITRLKEQKVTSIGGNPIIGKLFYDGAVTHLPALNMYVDGDQCRFENDTVIFKRKLAVDEKKNVDKLPLVSAPCHVANGVLKIDAHNHESYEGADGYNGAYSPASDTFFGVNATQELYQQWYGIPAFKDLNLSGNSKKIVVYMHNLSKEQTTDNWANAAFDPQTQTFEIGDGDKDYYPFSTLDVIAHELSHGFTDQHSNLIYFQQSGGINESFSDMASKALEFKMFGKINWSHALGVVKNGTPLRYMDEPTKDGNSIDNFKQYDNSVNVHYSSGIFNKAFYLLATTEGWDTKKAFDVMVAANRYYWMPTTDFHQGACGVVAAAHHFDRNSVDVVKAFEKVGITGLNGCEDLDPYHQETSLPFCPYHLDRSPLNKDQLPCRLGRTLKDVILPVESGKNTFTLTNYLNENKEIFIHYYEDCKVPSEGKEVIVELAGHATKTISLTSNCSIENVKRDNPNLPDSTLYRITSIVISYLGISSDKNYDTGISY